MKAEKLDHPADDTKQKPAVIRYGRRLGGKAKRFVKRVLHKIRAILVKVGLLEPIIADLGEQDVYAREMINAIDLKTMVNDKIPQETVASLVAISQENVCFSEGLIDENCD